MRKNEKLSKGLFIGNLPVNVCTETLRNILKSYGTIKQIQVTNGKVEGNVSQNSYGYALCLDKESLNNFLTKDIRYEGRKLKVRQFLSEEDILQEFDFSNFGRIVFIRGIPDFCTNSDLSDIFSPYGKVKSAYAIRPSKKNRSKFYGYIQYQEVRPAFFSTNRVINIGDVSCQCLPMTNLPNFIKRALDQSKEEKLRELLPPPEEQNGHYNIESGNNLLSLDPSGMRPEELRKTGEISISLKEALKAPISLNHISCNLFFKITPEHKKLKINQWYYQAIRLKKKFSRLRS